MTIEDRSTLRIAVLRVSEQSPIREPDDVISWTDDRAQVALPKSPRVKTPEVGCLMGSPLPSGCHGRMVPGSATKSLATCHLPHVDQSLR